MKEVHEREELCAEEGEGQQEGERRVTTRASSPLTLFCRGVPVMSSLAAAEKLMSAS
jgi:hypothetical protein